VVWGVVLSAAIGSLFACTTSPSRPRNPALRDPPASSDAAPSGPSSTVDAQAGAPPADRPPIDPASPACPPAPAVRKNAGAICACDNECATGFCQEGSCCMGGACGKRALGAPCQRNDQCESSQCADGVCCTVACSGICVSCNQPDRTGECMPVPAGQRDPREGCTREGEETCGLTGYCNGQGGCAKYAPGTACGAASCSGPRTFVPAGECDGGGICVKGEALECTPFTCEGGACRSSCVMDVDCVPPNVCTAGRCGLRGKGQACTAGEQCQSGFCVDGVCCENACTGRCQYCASPSSRGTCAPVRAGAPDPRAAAGLTDPALVCQDQGVGTCGNNGRCDGRGGCQRYENGATCRAARCETGPNAETGASICMNGSCRAPAAIGCAPFRGCTGNRCITQCGSDSQCASGFFCLDGTCGKRPTGGLCSRDGDCVSGICAQGRCCATECDSPCVACNLAGSLGTCSPVAAGAEDGDCGDPRCSSCDGMGGCTRSPGVACGNATCGNGPNRNAVVTPTCTEEGACQPLPRPCPMGELCRAAMCGCPPGRTRCETGCVDLQADRDNCGACGTTCLPLFQCEEGACVPPSCPPAFIRCGDDCINPRNDTAHCGRCDNNCATMDPPRACIAGTCTPSPMAPGF
jgi:hypothetical protein